MIIHEPFGVEHPYEFLPQERVPRRPIAGEAVTLGVVAAGESAIDRVEAIWWLDSDPQPRRVEGSQEASGWQVHLPAFQAGQRVTYRLLGQGPEGLAETPDFSFEVPGWQRPKRVARLECLPDGLAVWFDFTDPDTYPSTQGIFVRLDDDDHLILEVNPSSRKPPGESVFQSVIRNEDHLRLETDHLILEAWASPFSVEIRRDDGHLLLTAQEPEWLLFPGQVPLALRLSFASLPEETFHGFGERFNALDQRGERLDTLVYEQYKNQGRRTYIPMPWFLSSAGYGFFVETNERAIFDMASQDSGRWSVEIPSDDGSFPLCHVFCGPTPLENTRAFSRLTGQAEMPPEWIFGPWMSGNEWNTQAEVMRQVELTAAHDIPASVLVIEAWSDETTFYIWNGAKYDARPADQPFRYEDFTFTSDDPWPDPKGMIAELHRRGIRLVLWQIPVLKQVEEPHAQHDLDRQWAMEHRYCLHHVDGSPYRVRPLWFQEALLLDPSHPEARDWWLSKRAYLLDDLGVDGFKTDGGEHLWSSQVIMDNGARGEAAMNLYPNLYIGMYHQLMRERGRRPLTFSRAGFTGAHTIPCHWAGDENSTWPAFRASLLAGLNAALSGIIFWGWDIGGFSGEIPDAELYLRGTAMATFCPIMQYHSELNFHQKPSRDRTPWNIAERTGHPEVIDIYRHFAHLRLKLIPYLQSEAQYCVANAEPLMRPLFLNWPEEAEAWAIDDQYMLGRSLLVAPVMDPGAISRHLYLPPGEWIDIWTNQAYPGGSRLEVVAPLDRIPVFRRPGYSWPVPLDSDTGASE